VKDWKTIAVASGLPASAPELDRVVASLEALEEAFRPLVKDLPAEVEPATALHFGEDAE
jgi:hypothetical protein